MSASVNRLLKTIDANLLALLQIGRRTLWTQEVSLSSPFYGLHDRAFYGWPGPRLCEVCHTCFAGTAALHMLAFLISPQKELRPLAI